MFPSSHWFSCEKASDGSMSAPHDILTCAAPSAIFSTPHLFWLSRFILFKCYIITINQSICYEFILNYDNATNCRITFDVVWNVCVISGLTLFQSILRTRLQKSIEENKQLQDRASELSRQHTDSSALSVADSKELGKCSGTQSFLLTDVALCTRICLTVRYFLFDKICGEQCFADHSFEKIWLFEHES